MRRTVYFPSLLFTDDFMGWHQTLKIFNLFFLHKLATCKLTSPFGYLGIIDKNRKMIGAVEFEKLIV